MLIEAKPYEYSLNLEAAALLIIDMRRNFLEPGGFGEMLGNDVYQLRSTIGPNQALLAAFSSTRARATGPIWPTCRRPRRSAAAARPASAILARWDAFWCAARPATTSFPNFILPPGSR
jgi:hypothetical protein